MDLRQGHPHRPHRGTEGVSHGHSTRRAGCAAQRARSSPPHPPLAAKMRQLLSFCMVGGHGSPFAPRSAPRADGGGGRHRTARSGANCFWDPRPGLCGAGNDPLCVGLPSRSARSCLAGLARSAGAAPRSCLGTFGGSAGASRCLAADGRRLSCFLGVGLVDRSAGPPAERERSSVRRCARRAFLARPRA